MKTKEYHRPMPATWWMHNRHLVLFMIREVTSFFVAGFAIFLIILIYKANRGPAEFYAFFWKVLPSGWVRAYLLISLLIVCYHSITSFMAAPTIIAPRWGEDKIDPKLIILAHFGGWLILSFILILVLPK